MFYSWFCQWFPLWPLSSQLNALSQLLLHDSNDYWREDINISILLLMVVKGQMFTSWGSWHAASRSTATQKVWCSHSRDVLIPVIWICVENSQKRNVLSAFRLQRSWGQSKVEQEKSSLNKQSNDFSTQKDRFWLFPRKRSTQIILEQQYGCPK